MKCIRRFVKNEVSRCSNTVERLSDDEAAEVVHGKKGVFVPKHEYKAQRRAEKLAPDGQ